MLIVVDGSESGERREPDKSEPDDLAAVETARERIETRKSETVDLDEVAKELGVDLPPEEDREKLGDLYQR